MELVFTLIAFCLGLIIKDYLPAYSKKKGENLATKEDIAEITRIGKTIESKLKVPEKTNLILLDKRMEAIEHIIELQRLLNELDYDHQTKNAGQTIDLQSSWNELFDKERFIGSYFKSNHVPFLVGYTQEWESVFEAMNQLKRTLESARPENGGSGTYSFNNTELFKLTDNIKNKIFTDALEFEK